MAKPEGDGFLTIAEAVEAAASELELGSSDDSDTDDPSAEEALIVEDDQAEDEAEEQPETDGDDQTPSTDVEEQDDSLFGEIDLDDDTEETQEVDLESMTFELPNGEVVEGLQALKDGYMRTADYTQKTQKLAEERKSLEQKYAEADRIYQALRSDPMGFFSSLAKELGVEGVEVMGAKNPDFKLTGPDDIEKQIEERAREIVENDPEIQQARQLAAKAQVDQTFDQLEQDRGVTIKPQDRKKVLEFAVKNEIGNLEVAFDALMARVQSKKAKQSVSDRTKKTATKRSGGRVPEEDVTKPPRDVGEAMQRALAEMSANA